LGVYPQLAKQFRLGATAGAWVQSVVSGGPGDKAGVRAGDQRKTFQDQPFRVGGDVVTKIDGAPVREDADLARSLEDKRPGDRVTLTIVRDGATRQVSVTLGTRPLQTPRG
jgi:S1-C subfamily serine protease